MTLGASSEDWIRVPTNVKEMMIKKIEDRVQAVDDARAGEKKKHDAAKRSERNKAKTVSDDVLNLMIHAELDSPRHNEMLHVPTLPVRRTLEIQQYLACLLGIFRVE